MAHARDVIAYILQRQETPDLAGVRLMQLVYLADWRHVLEQAARLIEATWFFDSFGPESQNVVLAVNSNPGLFRKRRSVEAGGRLQVSLVDGGYNPRLSGAERSSLDHVLAVTSELSSERLTGLVYSTYPIVSCERFSRMNLLKAADAYRMTPVFQLVASGSGLGKRV